MISKSVEAITTVTQQTAAGTQEIARTVEDLNCFTENLQRLVDQFRLKPAVVSASSAARVRPAGSTLFNFGVRENGVLVKSPSTTRITR